MIRIFFIISFSLIAFNILSQVSKVEDEIYLKLSIRNVETGNLIGDYSVKIITESDTSTININQTVPEPILLKIDSASCLDILIDINEYGGIILRQCFENNTIYEKNLACFPVDWSKKKKQRILNKQFKNHEKYSDFEKFIHTTHITGVIN